MLETLPPSVVLALKALVQQGDRSALKERLTSLGFKIGHRLRLENELRQELHAASPASPLLNTPSPWLRVCFITTANAFIYDDSPTKLLPESEQGGNMKVRPTGGLMLTYSMVRYLKANFGDACTIIALDYIFHDVAPSMKQWEGHTILRGPPGQMGDALAALGLLDVWWHVAITGSASRELVEWTNTHLDRSGLLKIAMCHDYCGSPFGPFSSVPLGEQPDVCRGLSTGRWALLCDSMHTASYMQRHARRESVGILTARCAYGASYDYFALPGMSEPLRLGSTACAARMKYCTIISPCVPKGLAIFLRLAQMLPHVPFAACATSWTKDLVRGLLKKFPNVTILEASPRVDDIFEQTRVLLVPSIWPEAFGLVATEATARGIPCISTRHGGLVEANTLSTVPGFEEFAVPTTLFHDHHTHTIRRETMEAMEEAGALERDAKRAEEDTTRTGRLSPPDGPPTDEKEQLEQLFKCHVTLASSTEVRPFVDLVGRLMDADGESAFYDAASTAARASGLEFIRKHRGTFRKQLEDLWAETQMEMD